MSLSNKYKDESHLYENYKDLNDWVMNTGEARKNLFKAIALSIFSFQQDCYQLHGKSKPEALKEITADYENS